MVRYFDFTSTLAASVGGSPRRYSVLEIFDFSISKGFNTARSGCQYTQVTGEERWVTRELPDQ